MATTATHTSPQIERLVAQQQLVYQQMKLFVDQAARENRGFTDDETTRYKELADQHAALDKRIERAQGDEHMLREVERLTGHGGTAPSTGGARGSSAGALFASGTADFFKGGRHRTGAWRTEAVEVPYTSLFATTLTEDPASGGKLVIPHYLAGIQPSATRPLVVMDLLMPGTTTSNAVTYMQENTFTNSATPVAEGATKPESALVFTAVNEPVLKIAHWLPVSDELLEDVPAITAYIDGRLRLGVQLAEEDQLLNGNGTPPNFRGLLNRNGLNTTVVQAGGESVADAILRQIAAISATAYVQPTAVIFNPLDWTPQLTIKSTTNEYIGPSPFETPIAPTLWGLPVVLTPAIAPKTVLVGAFATQAQFFRRGDLRVEASNAHQDYFVRNLVAIRAEERGALCVYRPAAFGKVTLL